MGFKEWKWNFWLFLKSSEKLSNICSLIVVARVEAIVRGGEEVSLWELQIFSGESIVLQY